MANYGIIKALAKKKGVTLHEVARAINITPVGLSRIMRENTIRTTTLEDLCEYFDVSADYFFTDDENFIQLSDDNEQNKTVAEAIKIKMNNDRVSGSELARRTGIRQQRLWYLLNQANSVSEALGHSYGSKITSVYINFDQKKVDIANRRLIDLINN